MPSITENVKKWNESYHWKSGGEEWSDNWGDARMQWHGTILPRIFPFLPANSILEIAPGFGRWTQFLLDNCEKVSVVDVSEKCIKVCNSKFSDCQHLECFVNDGKSLEMIPNDSIDFVFSFDSLVHAEEDVIVSYLEQISRKLKINGVGFIHHSNIGSFKMHYAFIKILKKYGMDTALKKISLIESTDNWRAFSMTADKFRVALDGVGLNCLCQELVNWNTKRTIDCFTTFVKTKKVDRKKTKLVVNNRFMDESSRNSQIYNAYLKGLIDD